MHRGVASIAVELRCACNVHCTVLCIIRSCVASVDDAGGGGGNNASMCESFPIESKLAIRMKTRLYAHYYSVQHEDPVCLVSLPGKQDLRVGRSSTCHFCLAFQIWLEDGLKLLCPFQPNTANFR